MTNKHIILIAAFAPESGKSTFADTLTCDLTKYRPFGVDTICFAKGLKNVVSKLLEFSGYSPLEIDDALFGEGKSKEFKVYGMGQGITHRELLQKTGTEYRQLLGLPNLWLDITVGILARDIGSEFICVIDDWRFIEEYEGISKFAAENDIKVHTICIRNAKAEAKYKSEHSSEGGLTNFKFDHIFWNNMDEEFFDQAFEFAKIFEVKTDDSTV
ncbi:hypothetical protein [uncultured Agitococcus sp.]|uniref:hypothetical protein n=1 Tax=uncultured Agitococcus sp. TaxID=1506599 RepID=UPI002622F061|nr:hypothetical protein [uncultured Agitococcus sp.]